RSADFVRAFGVHPWKGVRPGLQAKTLATRQIRRSAGFQPAVSLISNRQRVASNVAPGSSGHPQAGSTAIQQVGNLRYDVVTDPADTQKRGHQTRPESKESKNEDC